MSKRISWVGVVGLGFLCGASGCELVVPPRPSNFKLIQHSDHITPEDLSMHAIRSSGRIEGKMLYLRAFTGIRGTYSVHAPRRFTPTNPPTLDLYLGFEALGDPGSRQGPDTLVVYLRSAFKLHEEQFENSEPWRIRLTTCGPSWSGTLEAASFYFDIPAKPLRTRPVGWTEEAEEIALWLGGEPHAPEALTAKVGRDLVAIRDWSGDESARFIFPSQPTGIALEVVEATAHEMLRNAYRAWDTANQDFGLDYMEFRFPGSVYLRFQERSHPEAIVAAYGHLPGVLCAQTKAPIPTCSGLYPSLHADGVRYLTVFAYELDPGGCLPVRTMWFVPGPTGEITLAGDWRADMPEPAWWAEARTAIDLYEGWRQCCAIGDCTGNP